jgi:NADH-quinone oxidoreductase subunit C
VSSPFQPIVTGHALSGGEAAPVTAYGVPRVGGAENPTAGALRERFGDAVRRVDVIWGETTVVVARDRLFEVVQWLATDEGQLYDYLSDVTAVEYREAERDLEVVWHLRSIPFRRFLRLKVMIERGQPLEVASVYPIYRGADWLERECYDMFGIKFTGHPDLRRILMWEQYAEGFPLRKDFPLRGRFSRSEQLRQALAANPEARYSMEELSIADAFDDLPSDVRERLAAGERTGE